MLQLVSSPNELLENSVFKLTRNKILFKMTQLLSYLVKGFEERVARLVWRHKMFHAFHFLQTDTVSGIMNTFL